MSTFYKPLAEKRQLNVRSPRLYFLICTNGKASEKTYFEQFKSLLPKHIEVKVFESSPKRLVKKTLRYDSISPIEYEEKWIIFDKDDFDCYEEAVKIISESGGQAGYSNECFETWLLMYFSEVGSSGRKECAEQLLNYINSFSNDKYTLKHLKKTKIFTRNY